MALSKTSRYFSLKQMGAAKLLPPEVVKMAKEVERMDGKTGKAGKMGTVDMEERLKSKTIGRDFDKDPDLVHQKSSADYIPPSRR